MKVYKLLNNIMLMLFFMFSVETFATSSSNLSHMKVDLSNQQSLQRGAKIFINYCLSCLYNRAHHARSGVQFSK